MLPIDILFENLSTPNHYIPRVRPSNTMGPKRNNSLKRLTITGIDPKDSDSAVDFLDFLHQDFSALEKRIFAHSTEAMYY